MTLKIAVAFVAHVLAFHLAVPEPVRVSEAAELQGFDGFSYAYAAYLYRVGPEWHLMVQPSEWRKLDRGQQEFLLIHELCHAVYQDQLPRGWDNLTEEEQRVRHERVERCTRIAIEHHRLGINHR